MSTLKTDDIITSQLSFSFKLSPAHLLTQLLQDLRKPLKIAPLEVDLCAHARPEVSPVLDHRHRGVVVVDQDGLHPVDCGGSFDWGERLVWGFLVVVVAVVCLDAAAVVIVRQRQSYTRHRASAELADLSRLQVWLLKNLRPQRRGDGVARLPRQRLQVLVDAVLAAADLLAEAEGGGNGVVGCVVGRRGPLKEELEGALVADHGHQRLMSGWGARGGDESP